MQHSDDFGMLQFCAFDRSVPRGRLEGALARGSAPSIGFWRTLRRHAGAEGGLSGCRGGDGSFVDWIAIGPCIHVNFCRTDGKELICVEVLSKSGIPIAIFHAFDKARRRL